MTKLTTIRTLAALAFAGSVVLGGVAAADENAELIINGDLTLVTKTAAPDHLKDVLDEIYSGWIYREEDTQAMQMDDFDNPGMVFVDLGMDAWNKVEGTADKSCASCHNDATESMKGVRASFPKWNEAAGQVRSMEQQVNHCRTENMGAEPYKYVSGNMANMVAMISLQSRGMPVNVAIDGPAQAAWEQGKEIYYTRSGVLDLSCASCHEENYGNYIRADHLSQGQTNGFPTYRLKNAKLNQTHDRFWGCIRDVRGEPYDIGSPEFTALELYVASRGNGLSVESPSVRN